MFIALIQTMAYPGLVKVVVKWTYKVPPPTPDAIGPSKTLHGVSEHETFWFRRKRGSPGCDNIALHARSLIGMRLVSAIQHEIANIGK